MAKWSWEEFFEGKKEADPLKKAKADLLYYGFMGGLLLFVFGLMIIADQKPEVRDLIGVEAYSKIAIALMFIVAIFYVGNVPTAIYRLLKYRKAPAESKG